MHAVSPVIATLILIVIAIVGAVAVGLIMSRVSADTSKAANANQVASNAATVLNVGGSSTIYPMIESALPTFESQYNVQLNVVLSSSGQGMEGVMLGALDIGAASSYPAVTSAVSYAATNYPGVNLVSTQIGGSGEVIIANMGGAHGFLVDTAANTCYGITKAALADIYVAQGSGPAGYAGTFTINDNLPATGCANGYLDAPAIVLCDTATELAGQPCSTPTPAGYTVPITVVYRSDSSGTQDTFSAYIGVGDKTFYDGQGESGNQGILSFVQAASAAHPAIGFTDFGFANGAAVGVTNGDADGVAITQVFTSTTSMGSFGSTTWGPLTAAIDVAADYPLAIANGASASLVSSVILSGLQAPAASIFPDTSATAGSTLCRNFYLVTNGTPNPIEQDFIAYFTQGTSASEGYATVNGFFNLYQINSGA